MNLEVPDWLRDHLTYWQNALHMWEWEIRLRLEMVLDGNEDCRGLASPSPLVNVGRIGIRADAENTEDWEVTFVHEMLHIKHSRIDEVIYQVLGPQVDMPDEVIEAVYKQALEPYIESMAKVLVKMRRGDE